eukprot:SAG31_NODE_1045_length_10180_cov_5.454221_6_plen_39_part_00
MLSEVSCRLLMHHTVFAKRGQFPLVIQHVYRDYCKWKK